MVVWTAGDFSGNERRDRVRPSGESLFGSFVHADTLGKERHDKMTQTKSWRN